jgi:SH3-like domain-containing protein
VRGAFLIVLAVLLPVVSPAGARAADPSPSFHPHYVSQRAAQVSLREGPGYDYRILWVYRHKGYPFRESASFDIWRRVTAADGTVGWINGQMLSDSRTVLVTGQGRAEIHKTSAPDSKLVGLAEPDAVLSLKACDADACRVRAPNIDGWISKSRIWGTATDEVFK